MVLRKNCFFVLVFFVLFFLFMRNAYAKNVSDELSDMIVQGSNVLVPAEEEIAKGNYEEGREGVLEAKKIFMNARKLYKEKIKYLSAADQQFFNSYLFFFNTLSDDMVSTADVGIEANKIMSASENADNPDKVLEVLPSMEIVQRALEELSHKWTNLDGIIERIIAKFPNSGLEDSRGSFAKFAQEYMDLAEVYTDTIEKLKELAPDYTSFREEEFPVEENKEEVKNENQKLISKNIISPQLEKTFKSFDKNKDGVISLKEGENFYYWVEENIPYRYDNENATNPFQGCDVGDGRSGPDYRQTPTETFNEKRGDCEDMATLEASFYQYFGHEAYVIMTNAADPKYLDHAVAIVRMTTSPAEFKKIFGGLVSYQLKQNDVDVYGKKIVSGTYFLVDNAYSDVFGYLSGGLKKGQFNLLCIVPYDKPFKQKEVTEIYYYKCGPMD